MVEPGKRIVTEDIDPQRAVQAFLGSQSTYDGHRVERVDTHISHLFLAGDRAFKLKRAVKLPFLDFSTVELRKAACEHEIEVNRMFASDLYLGIRPITKQTDQLAFDGNGAVIDWVVEMKRFDRRTEFDRLADRNELTGVQIDRLADRIAEQHLAADARLEPDASNPFPETVAGVAATLNRNASGRVQRQAISIWSETVGTMVADAGPKLDLRRRHGFVRHCHGDLHLANICLVNGNPTPFDAIEFNDLFATIDVLYDLGFTVMDLIHRDRRVLANRLLNRYLAQTGDYCGTSLLPLFMSVRAAIRAMVAMLPEAKHRKTADAESLIALAGGLVREAPRPRLMAIGGVSGTGKSSLALRLATDMASAAGAIVLRSDVIRKRLSGVAPEEHLANNAYGQSSSRRVYRRMIKQARQALQSDQTVILDAVFLEEEERSCAEKLAQDLQCPFQGLWLEAPDIKTLERRIALRKDDASDATVAVLRSQVEQSTGEIEWHRVNASGPPETVAARSLEILGKKSTAKWPS